MRRKGFTLVEALIALAIGAVVLGAIYELMFRARRDMEDGTETATLQSDADDLARRVADALLQAGTGSPDWSLSEEGDAVTFNRCLGASGGAPIWGEPLTLAALPLEGASDEEGGDGTDNNGDGLTDERSLVLLDTGSGQEVATWSGCLASPGLLLELSGNRLTVTVTVQSPGGATAATTATATLRN